MKKKYFYFVLLGILLLVIAACVPTTTNVAPTAPSNPDPANGETGVSVTPTLSWTQSIDPNGDRVTYDLYLGTDRENLEENPLVKESNLDATSYTITEPLDYETTYYWKVVAKDGKGGQIASPVWSFITEEGSTNTPPSSPTNPNPADEATGVSVTPTLGWQASRDPDGDSVTYDLYFGEVQDALSLEATDLTTNSYEFTESLNYETTYYWKVVAKDGNGGETSSEVWSFTTIKTTEEPNTPPNAPSNPDPEDGETGVSVTPTLNWQASDEDDDALTYDLYFGETEDTLSVKASNLGTNSYEFTESLDYETTYYWQVVAKDGKGGQTEGPIWSFTTKANEPPSAPTNPSPANETSGVSVTPTLGWQASRDPDGDSVTYDLYFGEAQDSLSVKASNLTDNSYTFADSLDYGTTYYWKVEAKDGKGGETEGPVWSFTTNYLPTMPSNPDPEDGETGVSLTPTLSWQASDDDGDALTYDLYFGTEETNLSVKASNLGTNSYEFTESLDYGTTYYWQVKAKDGQGGETLGPVWSFTTIEEMEDVISDLNDLSESDSLYILKAFIDEDINYLMSGLDDYIDTNAPDLEESEDFFEIITAIKEYYEGLWEVYDGHQDATEKLQDMMYLSESLFGDMDLRVQIVDQAKEDIIKALGGTEETEEPETLVVDYRDLLNMRMQVWGLLSLYEMKEPLQPYFEAVSSIEQNGPLVYFLLEDSYDDISEFIGTYIIPRIGESSNEPWETADFWNDLNSLVTTLAGITGESDVLTTGDIFKEDVLYINGLDFVIEKGKFVLESFNDLYYFEEEKTNELGWTDDDAISLYEYPYFVYVVGDINIKQTESMGEPIDLISELLPEELSSLKDIVKELTFGNIDLLQETSWIELSEELNSVLPNGVLELIAKIETPVIIEGSVNATVSIDISINLDFGALSDGTPLDIMSNNLGMNPAMISDLIAEEIWDILASDNMTQNQASAIYDIILSNLTFYDPDTNTLTIEIDDSITAEVVINLEWE